jgi:hypothetical protein
MNKVVDNIKTVRKTLENAAVLNPYGSAFNAAIREDARIALAALEAIEQALGQGEPVARYLGEGNEGSLVQLYDDIRKGTDLYTTPQPQPQDQDDAAASVNETNAILASRYFDLLKVVEAYEKHGVTCQTFRHFVDSPCAECNSVAAPQPQPQPKQEPVKLPCCGYYDATAIKWNQLNGIVQCHNCGESYAPQPQREWVGLTPEDEQSLCQVGPVYAPDGVVTRKPLEYRNELQDVALMAVRKADAKLREKNEAPTCSTCTSSQPTATRILCGLCCGPTSPSTKYERIVNVVRHNSPAPAQVPRQVRATSEGGTGPCPPAYNSESSR